MIESSARRTEYEFIVIGSGAGGGTVAARLAEAGHSVLVLEAGGDPLQLKDERLPEDYQVPAFHAFASENPRLRWDFFVRHYANEEQQRRDPKYTLKKNGVLYPRAGTLGGCTAHHAMIFVYPNNSDWDHIAQITGDVSWRATAMRRYFQRLEDCRHRPLWRFVQKLTRINPTLHGFAGWLPTERAYPPKEALRDREMMDMIERTAFAAIAQLDHPLKRLFWFIRAKGDPNDWRSVRRNAFGVRYLPLTTSDHQRFGSRERLLDVAARYPEKLHIELDALASRIMFDADHRAVGVEYLKGKNLYRAHDQADENSGQQRQAKATREVILCGGAFNTPQLLMLSGIGPKHELTRHGIEAHVDLAGVGANLQDRYEVSVVNRMREDWECMAGAEFARGDRQFVEWQKHRKGIYATNGGLLTVIKHSRAQQAVPDLFCMSLLARFEGYFPGYSKLISDSHDFFSWVILKAHTQNRAGTVKLRSADPRDPPEINFHYFDESADAGNEDLRAVVDGIKFVRAISTELREEKLIVKEELPGDNVQSDNELKDFVRSNAWGHHASCSCPIGAREDGGVLSSDFRVHGTHGLRVVDASVFPRIPGYFIVSAVYMIAEKAADVILSEAR